MLEAIFWGVAMLFSIIFLWQLVATLLGYSGGHEEAGAAEHVEAGGDEAHAEAPDHEHGAEHAAESVATFKLLSVRSVSAFGLLFGWAGVLYLSYGTAPNLAVLYSALWGLVGMVIVSGIFYLFRRMTEVGTARLATCVGKPATVYMDIPACGTGKVRTLVSETVSFVSARAAGDMALPAGTAVIVKRLVDASTVEVEKVQP